MLFAEKSSGYPILEGHAVVKVSLREASVSQPFFVDIAKKLQGLVLSGMVNSYYYRSYQPSDVSIVTLENYQSDGLEGHESLEYDIFSDQISLMNRAKAAITGLVAAGIILVSAIGLGRISDTPSEPAPLVHSMGKNVEDGRDKCFPVINNYCNREKDLFASLVPGVSPGASKNHYFRLSGHNNVSHSNYAPYALDVRGGEHPHHNLFEPHCDHSNHNNIAHSNHDNLAHSNNEVSSHDNAAHADHANLGTLNTHTDGVGGHANGHENVAGHTNVAA